jgi:DNA-directed RNA polymerase specialized sigma24 family protein
MQKGMRSILVKLYESGMSMKEIAEKTELDIKQVEEILS